MPVFYAMEYFLPQSALITLPLQSDYITDLYRSIDISHPHPLPLTGVPGLSAGNLYKGQMGGKGRFSLLSDGFLLVQNGDMWSL